MCKTKEIIYFKSMAQKIADMETYQNEHKSITKGQL